MTKFLNIMLVVGGLQALGAIAQADPARGARSPTVAYTIGDDTFAAGASIRFNQPVSGDLLAAGGMLDIDAAVGGDTMIAGGNVQVDGPIGASLYAIGGRVVAGDSIGRNARIGGGGLELARRAVVNGNLAAGAGQLSLLGTVLGHVSVAAGRLYLNGPVGGDVVAFAGAIELGPQARIAGRLRYGSPDEIKRDPAAVVGGGVERMAIASVATPPEELRQARREFVRVAGWAWSIGLIVIAALTAGAWPRVADRVADTVRSRWPMSLLIGFIGVVCTPVLAVILLLTLIGVPLGILALALYPVLLVIGYVAAGAAVGVLVLRRLSPDRSARTSWRIGAGALGMLAVTLLARVPAVGAAVVLLAMLIGIGALLLQFRRQAPT